MAIEEKRRHGRSSGRSRTSDGLAAAAVAALCLAGAGGWIVVLPAPAWLALGGIGFAAAWLAERRRARAASAGLKTAIEERRLMLECIEVTPTPFAVYDAENRLIAWNPSYEHLHAVAFDTLPRPIRYEDLMRGVARGTLPPDQVEKAVAERVAIHQTADGAAVDRLYTNGHWLRVTKQRTRSGAIAGFAADVTELKRREAELLASEARLRDFAETASDWLWETGSDDRVAFVSDRLEALGFDPAAWLGRLPREIAVEPEREPAAWAWLAERAARREPFRDLTFRAQGRNGAIRYVALSGKPIVDAGGAFAGYRGVGRDVTDAVLASHALREAREQAESASRSKSEFLANMSHELRTPLNAIIGFSEMMKSGMLGTADGERYRSYAADIHVSGMHLLGIINDILDVARIEAGRLELHEERLRLAEVATDAIRMMTDQIERAGLTVVAALDRELPPVLADERSLRQILLNLISNAVKFTPRGGTVTVGLARDEAGGACLSIRDTGIGIAAEDLPRLMQPFAQIDGAYQRQRQGTGLGLTLVRSLTELHGGAITIDSAPGDGTTVSILLPAWRFGAGQNDESRAAAG